MIDIAYPEIYFDPKTNQYYYTGETLICDKCGRQIENLMVLSISWMKRESVYNVYCINDAQSAKGVGFINEAILVNLVDDRPAHAYRYLMRPPGLVSYSGDSVWSAAIRGNKGVRIIDRTRLALKMDPGRQMIEAQQQQARAQLEMMDSKILHDEDDFDVAIQDIVRSTPVIEYDEKQKIGFDG